MLLTKSSCCGKTIEKYIEFILCMKFVHCTIFRLRYKSSQRARHTHLVGGIELPKRVQCKSRESNSYRIRGMYKINAIN